MLVCLGGSVSLMSYREQTNENKERNMNELKSCGCDPGDLCAVHCLKFDALRCKSLFFLSIQLSSVKYCDYHREKQ